MLSRDWLVLISMQPISGKLLAYNTPPEPRKTRTTRTRKRRKRKEERKIGLTRGEEEKNKVRKTFKKGEGKEVKGRREEWN